MRYPSYEPLWLYGIRWAVRGCHVRTRARISRRVSHWVYGCAGFAGAFRRDRPVVSPAAPATTAQPTTVPAKTVRRHRDRARRRPPDRRSGKIAPEGPGALGGRTAVVVPPAVSGVASLVVPPAVTGVCRPAASPLTAAGTANCRACLSSSARCHRAFSRPGSPAHSSAMLATASRGIQVSPESQRPQEERLAWVLLASARRS